MESKDKQTSGLHNSVPGAFQPVETSVPAFIGYTENAIKDGQSLLNKPTRIDSLNDFNLYFGGAAHAQFSIVNVKGTPQAADFHVDNNYYKLEWSGRKYFLYNCLRLFYENGGGPCYIVSVGNYESTVKLSDFIAGLNALSSAVGPTLLLAPDAVLIADTNKADYGTLLQAMLQQAGGKGDRMAVLDVYHGFGPAYVDGETTINVIDQFRSHAGSECLSYGVAYYPWLYTSIVQNTEIDFTNIADGTDGIEVLKAILNAEAAIRYAGDTDKRDQVQTQVALLSKTPSAPYTVASLGQKIGAAVPLLIDIYGFMQRKINILPPASAMAGIYHDVDTNRGVWKSPANVALSGVTAPTVSIDDDLQQDLNVPLEWQSSKCDSFISRARCCGLGWPYTGWQ